MKILVWATTFQADILSLALYIDRAPDCTLLVVTRDVAAYRSGPVSRALPLSAPLLARDDAKTRAAVISFDADVVVFDNHFPPRWAAKKICSAWHGLGWKARGHSDLKDFHRTMRKLSGSSVEARNAQFMAQCYGAPDYQWRIEQWKIHPDNCRVVGMSFSDLLLHPPYTKERLSPYYSIDILQRKTVLLSFTWHFGRIFLPDPKEDFAALQTIIKDILSQGANVLLSMHDKRRYSKAFLDNLKRATSPYDGVMIKHRDENADNLADLLVSDVMVSNYSSFITYFYFLGRPSVHVPPVGANDKRIELSRMRWGRVAKRTLAASEPLWMTPLEDHGGLKAATAEEISKCIAYALQNPDCCRERSQDFISRHIHEPNGRSSERFLDALRSFVVEH